MNWTEEDLTRHLQRRKVSDMLGRNPLDEAQRYREHREALKRSQAARGILNEPVSKYRSRRTQVICSCRGELWFDSAKEANRYQELRLLEIAGAITDLELQPRFDVLGCNGEVVAHFKADFRFWDVRLGQRIIEEVKSTATKKAREYPLKLKLLRAAGTIITEV